MTTDRRRPRGRPATAPLQGDCEEHHRLVAMMDRWRHQADLSRAEVFRRFNADHFAEGMPKRTAVYDMFKGKGITWEFIDAVADICTATAESQQQLCAEARPVWEKAQEDPTPLDAPGDATQQRLIDALSELAAVQAELLHVRQLREASDQNILAANQMVMMLFMIIGQLQAKIVSLNHQISSLIPRQSTAETRTSLTQKLTEATHQHEIAQSELERAQNERDDALKLSSEATTEAHVLQEDVQLLREVNGLGIDEELEKPLPPLPAFGAQGGNEASVDDVSETLERITQQLDYRAEDLATLQEGLGNYRPREKDGSVVIGEVVLSQDGHEDELGEGEEAASAELEEDRPELPGPSLAEQKGCGPKQLMRYADAALKKDEDALEIHNLLSRAAPYQSEEERVESRRLLSKLRDGSEVVNMWNLILEGKPVHVARLHPRTPADLAPFSGFKMIEPVSGQEPWTVVAQLISLRIKESQQPRFAIVTLKDETKVLAVGVNDLHNGITEACRRVLARLDYEVKTFLINALHLPEGELKDGILSIAPWHSQRGLQRFS